MHFKELFWYLCFIWYRNHSVFKIITSTAKKQARAINYSFNGYRHFSSCELPPHISKKITDFESGSKALTWVSAFTSYSGLPLHLMRPCWLSHKNEQLGVHAPNIAPNHWQAHLKPRMNFKHFKDRLIWKACSSNEARPSRLRFLHNGYIICKGNQVLYQHHSW